MILRDIVQPLTQAGTIGAASVNGQCGQRKMLASESHGLMEAVLGRPPR